MSSVDGQVPYDFGGSFYALRLGPAHVIVLAEYADAGATSPQIASPRQRTPPWLGSVPFIVQHCSVLQRKLLQFGESKTKPFSYF